MKYKCVNSFVIDGYDEDGFQKDKVFLVVEGSVWTLNDSANYINADHHLDNEKTGEWLEISDISLKEDFVLMEGSNNA